MGMGMDIAGYLTTDLKDFITGKTFEMVSPDRRAHGGNYHGSFRGVVKEGLTSFDLGTAQFDAVVTNGTTYYSPTGSIPCGENITFYLSGGGKVAGYSDDWVSLILSQLDVLVDPLPFFVVVDDTPYLYDDADPFITNEDFTTLNGVFDNPDQQPYVFIGSLVKTIPRIYSDYALKEMTDFGGGSSHYYTSAFKNMPNVEGAEPQGEFGDKLVSLKKINLSYRVPGESVDRVDAYPSGGSPKVVNGYVMADRVLFSSKFPSYSGDRLEVLKDHIDVKEVIIDTGAPSLPFGGVTFKNSNNMTLLMMPDIKWVVGLEASPATLNFCFSWGSLGVEAPPSCDTVIGLHKIWQSVGAIGFDTQIATPSSLKNGIHTSWGSQLQALVSSGLQVTDDFMPLVPSGVKMMVDYYSKTILGEADDAPARMESLRQKPWLDGVHRFYVVQPLQMTGDNRILHNYVSLLYSDLVIDFDITIPALPEGLSLSGNAYYRTFYNAIGITRPIDLGIKPILTVFYSVSSPDYHYPHETAVIPDLNATYDGPFREAFEGAISVGGVSFGITEAIGSPSLDSRYQPDYWVSGDTVRFNYLNDFINYAKGKVDDVQQNISVIESSIVLERGVASAPIESWSFQKECFYGAAIDPTVVDAIIPLPESGIDADSYFGALNIFVGIGSIPIRYSWTPQTLSPMVSGYTTTQMPDEDYNRLLSFTAMITWSGGDNVEQQDKYRYKLDDVIFNGSPRVETYWNEPSSSRPGVYRPYFYFLSDKVIKGSQEAFMLDHGIVLDDGEDFNATSTSMDMDGSFVGSPIGFNVYRDYIEGGPTPEAQGIDRFTTSYDKVIDVGIGLPEPTGRQKFFDRYKPHNGEEWEGGPGWITGNNIMWFTLADPDIEVDLKRLDAEFVAKYINQTSPAL